MSNHKEQQGFLTFAINSDHVDYLSLAFTQAKNVKATQKINKFAVIVDKNTNALITDDHRAVFDYVIELPENHNHAMSNEPLAFWLTPFKETIKLESDLLLTRSIDHWWYALRLRDVVLSSGCKTYRGTKSTVRKYRKVFDDNQLPDIYNGLMYFRYSKSAAEFFTTATQIVENWEAVRESLIRCDDAHPSTDLLYALAANVVGREECTLPSLDFINFVHMKPGIQGWSDSRPWYETVMAEQDGNMIRINNLNQYHPVHYYDKDFKYND